MDKNLLIISPEYYSFVKDQTETLAPSFNRIEVYVRHNPFSEISNILPLHTLKPFRKKYLINLEGLPENVSVTPTPILYLPTDTGYLNLGKKHYSAVEKIVRNKISKSDIIQAHFIWTSGYVGIKLKEKFGNPLVITAHGYDVYELPFKNEIWKEKIINVLNNADHVITVSQKNRACLHKLDIRTPITVIPNGFRHDLFHPQDMQECRKKLGLPPDKKIILSVGNLVPVKGHEFLVRAMAEITRVRDDVICVIVGDGDLKNILQQQITKSGLEKKIFLFGSKPHKQIPLWINSCDVFVLPSLNEGMPTVVFEALGCGKPFVGTKVGGVPEIITSDEYGLLVEAADPSDLAEKILVALDLEWDKQKILNYGERFTWKNISKEILTIYQRVGM